MTHSRISFLGLGSAPAPTQSQHFAVTAALKLLGLRLAFSMGSTLSRDSPRSCISFLANLARSRGVSLTFSDVFFAVFAIELPPCYIVVPLETQITRLSLIRGGFGTLVAEKNRGWGLFRAPPLSRVTKGGRRMGRFPQDSALGFADIPSGRGGGRPSTIDVTTTRRRMSSLYLYSLVDGSTPRNPGSPRAGVTQCAYHTFLPSRAQPVPQRYPPNLQGSRR